MFKKYILGSMLLTSFFVSSLAHAYTDVEVGNWVQRILMDTFTASYKDKPSEIYAVQKNFSPAAWGPMRNFFAQELQIIQEYKLSLHPQFITRPTIINKGDYQGVESWRANQSFNIPELHMTIECSALIIKTSQQTPFLIQSIDMKVQHY